MRGTEDAGGTRKRLAWLFSQEKLPGGVVARMVLQNKQVPSGKEGQLLYER
jgi:hypothetical protein